mmetsp:Transcript_26386/g.63650  ORF Transcript_26386/g.63650 Transcript_26386/m.63650 type:complete len:678 (-) Transcript_26386:306-2339(-)
MQVEKDSLEEAKPPPELSETKSKRKDEPQGKSGEDKPSNKVETNTVKNTDREPKDSKDESTGKITDSSEEKVPASSKDEGAESEKKIEADCTKKLEPEETEESKPDSIENKTETAGKISEAESKDKPEAKATIEKVTESEKSETISGKNCEIKSVKDETRGEGEGEAEASKTVTEDRSKKPLAEQKGKEDQEMDCAELLTGMKQTADENKKAKDPEDSKSAKTFADDPEDVVMVSDKPLPVPQAINPLKRHADSNYDEDEDDDDDQVIQAKPKRPRLEGQSDSKMPPLEPRESESHSTTKNSETTKNLKPGDRIAIYWPMEKANYSGTLVRENSPGHWLVQYDDGDLRLHALHSDRWKFHLPSEDEDGKEKGGNWTKDPENKINGGEKRPQKPIRKEKASSRLEVDDEKRRWNRRDDASRRRRSRQGDRQIQEGAQIQPVPREFLEEFEYPAYLTESWGMNFERHKQSALAECRILMGLIQRITPNDPTIVDTIRSFTNRFKGFGNLCKEMNAKGGPRNLSGNVFSKKESGKSKAPAIMVGSQGGMQDIKDGSNKMPRASSRSQKGYPVRPGIQFQNGMADNIPARRTAPVRMRMNGGSRTPMMMMPRDHIQDVAMNGMTRVSMMGGVPPMTETHAPMMMRERGPVHPQQSIYMPSHHLNQRVPYPDQRMGMMMRLE